MSRVFRDHDKYVRECEARAAAARAGKLNTHEIQQANLSQEWIAPEGWTAPVTEDKE